MQVATATRFKTASKAGDLGTTAQNAAHLHRLSFLTAFEERRTRELGQEMKYWALSP